MGYLVIINTQDNVGNAVVDIDAGQRIEYSKGEVYEKLHCLEKIPFGFKVAIQKIHQGDPIIKYGVVIGKASADINPGQLVHTHNVEGNRGRGDISNG